MNRQAVRAIVLRDDELLVMHRNKFGTEYDTLPGGNVEVGEDHDQAIRREVHEETSMELGSTRLVFMEQAGDPYGPQFIYLCDYVAGEPELQPGSEEALINKLGKNLYDPRWLPLADLPEASFLSEKLKKAILDGVANGFPAEPQQIR